MLFSITIALNIYTEVFAFAPSSYKVSTEQIENMQQNLQDLPVIFRKNAGQWDNNILYSGSTKNAHVYFMQNGLSFGFGR